MIGEANLETRLKDNPCRGIVVGLDESNRLVQFSWIMGRSDNSQNRVYEKDGNTVRTAPADVSKVEDPSLIIYNAMRSRGNVHIVSNGDQTDTIMNWLFDYDGTNLATNFQKALQLRFCEPDAPTRTPRISAAVETGSATAYFSILRPDPVASAEEKTAWSSADKLLALSVPDAKERQKRVKAFFRHKKEFPTQRDFYERQLHPGMGYCLTTYNPGSRSLPAFTGDPFVVPIVGDAFDAMNNVWNHLEPEWKVAIAGKYVAPDGKTDVHMINTKKVV